MSSASSMVDWDLAGRTARRLINAGPSTTREEAAGVGGGPHGAAAGAVAHVEQLTGLRPVPGGPVPEVVVVDRPSWVDANASGMGALLDPLVAAPAPRAPPPPAPPRPRPPRHGGPPPPPPPRPALRPPGHRCPGRRHPGVP